MNKIELLAPVGTKEALVAAVFNGADAVYLAGKSFGARKFAANFDRDDLIEAVKFCHRHGVSVFVTVNTLVADFELEQLDDYIDFLYKADVDALIVQDFGVLGRIKDRYPDFEIHASTQMTAHSTEDIHFLKSQGVSRVVLPREMNVLEIESIRENTDLDFECFVHGALCVSYSGQCLMSSMIGGRSGNRGSCAQSCRQAYTLVDIDEERTQEHKSGKYLLSPKDLRALEEVPALIKAGVNAFKIEGRMKRPEYAAVVVKAYREAIDAAQDGRDFDLDRWKKATADIFTRGFTKGHLFSGDANDRMNPFWPGNNGVKVASVKKYDKDRKRMTIHIEESLHVGDEIQIRRGNTSVGARVEFIEIGRARVKEAQAGQDIVMNMQYPVKAGEVIYRTVNDALLKEARQSYARQVQRVAITMEMQIKKNQPMILTLIDDEGKRVSVKGEVPEAAMNRPLDKDRVEKQVLKLGDSPYECEALSLELDDGLALPMKHINALRREAVEALDEERSVRYKHRQDVTPKSCDLLEGTDEQMEEESHAFPMFRVQVRTVDQLRAALDTGVDGVMVSTLEMLDTALEETKDVGCPLIFAPGRIVRDFEYDMFTENLETIRQSSGIWAGTYGMLEWAKKHEIPVLGVDQGLNIFNSYAVKMHKDQAGVMTLSPEMTMYQMKNLKRQKAELEALVYGRQTVMVTEYCPVSAVLANGHVDCGLCEKMNYGLQDKKGAIFPVLRATKTCRTEILNSKILFVPEELETLYDNGVHHYRMVFTLEDRQDTETEILLFKRTMDHELTEEDEEARNRFVSKGLTRGHYYRGVFADD